MIEAEWWEYDDQAELADALSSDAAFVIESALDARGDAVVALPGGRTPAEALNKLAASKLKWRNVTIIPTDDRLVAVDHEASNVRQLAGIFLPLGGRVVPLTGGSLAPDAAGKAADARLQDLHWPPDLVWLGMGADGHTASIFPGNDLDAALATSQRAIGVTPAPLPAEAPFPRVTLSANAIRSTRALMISITGAEKRAVLEQALEEGESSLYPIGRVLAAADLAIDIHWAP